ncbi:MAG: ATP-binding cassette domain-containing protein, partial [Lewinella sp.]|nr:ATP-binding cassette domain-containing protein [Lewinella sp.]
MSVSVQQLTKIYGAQRAVDDISFEARPGEVLGFLGPNGAGKTTTMKMITGYLPPDAGEITVCGLNVEKDPLGVQRRIGYLPEHNPLYGDMYVREFLTFVARIHKLSRPAARIAELIEQTGLTREQHKPISALSKGYRQRVGLAQALLHDPDVLILDEPTAGLDPNQLAEIRTLIQRLGQEKTVILSTHIMQEVQALCRRVVIINRGQLVANDPIEQLQARLRGDTIITVGFQEKTTAGSLKKIGGVSKV